MLKSKISNHKATKEEVISRAIEVYNCGKKVAIYESGHTTVATYELGSNTYIITFVNYNIKSFEFLGVYLFEL